MPTDNALNGRTALVTDACSDLGTAIARSLADAGATVIVADADELSTASTADALNRTTAGAAIPWQIDLTDTDALTGDPLSIDGEHHPVDILVNTAAVSAANAGLQRAQPIEETTIEDWRRIQTIMLEVPFLLTRAVLPDMYANGWGRIVNISSVYGLRAAPLKSSYIAAKHGVMGLTKATALEAGPHGVTCNAINPSFVMTPYMTRTVAARATAQGVSEQAVMNTAFLTRSAIPELPTPEDIAGLVRFLCSDDARVINGAAHSVDGGWTVE